MENSSELVFEYRIKGKTPLSGWGTTGVIIWLIAFLSVFTGFVVFLVAAFKTDIKFIWLADIFGILSLIFGPYALYVKRFFYFALTESNILIMKSTINFIPRSYKVDLNTITSITPANPAKAMAIEFRDKNGKVTGRFNPLSMKKKQFDGYLKVISERNKNLEIKI